MTHFTELQELLPSLGFDHDEAGGALSVFYEGRCVISTAFGQARPDEKWSPHTLSVNFSIGKGVLATLVAVLVSKGVLAYDVPIGRYWADFAVNGKERITLLHVLTHQSGLFNINHLIESSEAVKDWQGMLKKVAAMPTDIPHGQDTHHYGSAYSALVSGWILGGVIEQATGQSLQSVLDEHLAEPLGVKGELFFGLPATLYDTLALPKWLFEPAARRSKPTLKPDSDETAAFLATLPITSLWQDALKNQGLPDTLTTQNINQLYFDVRQMNLKNYKNALLPDGKNPINYHAKDIITVPIPAANGVSSAHALGVMYAMHANEGSWQGQTLINSATLASMRQIRTTGFDAVMPADMRWRAGFHRLLDRKSVV